MKTGTIHCDAYTQENCCLLAASMEAAATLRYWACLVQPAQDALRQHEFTILVRVSNVLMCAAPRSSSVAANT